MTLREVGRNEEAVLALTDAANQGNAQAMRELSRIYTEKGLSVRDQIRSQAETTGADSEEAINKSEEVRSVNREMIRWTRMAAEHGVFESQVDLSVIYFLGYPLPKDDVLAYVWQSIAEKHAPTPASLATIKKMLQKIKQEMTPEQILNAEGAASKILRRIKQSPQLSP